MNKSLTDKVAIITGGGRGLGEAIARGLAGAGARVAVNDINPDRASRVAEEINDDGGQAIDITADVSNKFQCVYLVERTRKEWDQLDILINCAGIEPESSILKMDEWDWDRCIDVNLKGTFLMSQLCGRVMAEENTDRGGTIINISSLAGVEVPLAHRAAYCASNAGIVGFSRECAREFAEYGIRVKTIMPGIIKTSKKEELVEVVVLLCADGSSYTTGSIITIDGGKVMGERRV